MALASAEILYFCFGCLFLTAACLEITYSSSEMVDDDSFITGSEVNFTCTHQSYQGVQKWTFDAMKVLDCGFIVCDDLTSSDDRFSFSNDMNNGIFIFTIKDIELSDDGKIIECDDGSAKTMFEIKVKGVITSSTSPTPNNVSGGCINTCDCCKCNIKDLIIVIAVAWASAITITFVGSCILKYFLNTADLHECIFNVGFLPWIFLLVVVMLYKGEKKRGLIPLVISFVLDAVFIGIDRYYVCLCENVCEIELLDHLWASFIYLMVCAVLSELKYFILEMCCKGDKSDSTVSNSNPNLNQSDMGDRHEQRGASPLPRISSVSSRLGNEKEYEFLTHEILTHHFRFS